MGLKNMLRKWLLDDGAKTVPGLATRAYYNEPVCCDDSGGNSTNPSPEVDSILNFRVYNAVGSYVVEFHRYDRKSDRRDNSLYTIKHDEDFGEAISKISQAEILKQ